ncbi:hypothetical protein [uncultured Sunxiuqinia sp.]|uniref:hypothetical protein n=1 Tax=uncultured Sunxiuqinia sp. TaxID=1573825 RepID=UPI0030DB4C3F|tara:strand:+ start:7833 stop:9614 length:1782 start_codon:yes stop_codon:yes gene_type:complete
MSLNKHTFSIPVMGLGYTIDTPVRVAHFGISSVISLVDDILMEKMREFYSQKFDIPYQTITNKAEDFRAKRITAYLNLVDELVNRKYDELVNSLHKKESELEKYFELLPDSKQIREKFNHLMENKSLTDVKNWLRTTLRPGSIDVNIMTKLDKANYLNREQLPAEYNDAHAALRGFANSKLSSSLVLSAGMNPRLYSYLENFSDFYPDENGQLRKKITLKVSDFRSALIQGRFLAKKGIWISEYRVESGLNCGGHAFATQGYLLGPILKEFKEKRQELIDATFEVYQSGLKEKGLAELSQTPEIRITAQGGVGTNEEHQLLLEEYNLDSIGWGSPFMLVPEACNIDEESLNLLKNAGEDDLYLSDASPLGVPFNNVRGASQQKAIQNYLAEGKPGFPCTKKYLVFNTEYTEIPICTASKQYLKKKLNEVEESEMGTDEKQYQKSKLTEKECLCEGLTNSTYLANGLETDSKRTGVSICPGPNIAYFKQVVSLKEMVDHIYGKINLLKGVKRPNLFLKELHMYVEYLENRLREARETQDNKQLAYLRKFQANLNEGINYYRQFFEKYEHKLQEMKRDVFSELEAFTQKLEKNKI